MKKITRHGFEGVCQFRNALVHPNKSPKKRLFSCCGRKSLTILATFGCLALGNRTQAATVVLNNATEATLRSAIAAGGAIKFGNDVQIFLGSPLVIATNVTIDGSGRNIYLHGGSHSRIFEVKPFKTLKLFSLNLLDGTAAGDDEVPGVNPPRLGRGGAILNVGGTVEINSSTISFNSAQGGDLLTTSFAQAADGQGGAIHSSGVLIVSNTVFKSNVALGGRAAGAASGLLPSGNAYGGVIFNEGGSVTLVGCDFSANSAFGGNQSGSGGSDAAAGAVYSSGGTARVLRTIFQNNRANGMGQNTHGGAIFVRTGPFTVEDAYFFKNAATGGFSSASSPETAGGAIFNESGLLSVSRASFVSNYVTGGYGVPPTKKATPKNSPAGGNACGGGIASRGPLNVTNSTFSLNSVSGGWGQFVGGSAAGGAIAFLGAPARSMVSFSTFAANVVKANTNAPADALKGSTLFSSAAGPTLNNSILSSKAVAVPAVAGPVADGGYNLGTDNSLPFTLASSRVSGVLGLGPVLYLGGFAPTIPLLSGSPALNKADPLAKMPTDERNRSRPFGGGPDIGAFESRPPYAIYGTVDGGLFYYGKVTAAPGTQVAQVQPDNSYLFTNFNAGTYTLKATNGLLKFYSSRTNAVLGPDVVNYNFTTNPPTPPK